MLAGNVWGFKVSITYKFECSWSSVSGPSVVPPLFSPSHCQQLHPEPYAARPAQATLLDFRALFIPEMAVSEDSQMVWAAGILASMKHRTSSFSLRDVEMMIDKPQMLRDNASHAATASLLRFAPLGRHHARGNQLRQDGYRIAHKHGYGLPPTAKAYQHPIHQSTCLTWFLTMVNRHPQGFRYLFSTVPMAFREIGSRSRHRSIFELLSCVTRLVTDVGPQVQYFGRLPLLRLTDVQRKHRQPHQT